MQRLRRITSLVFALAVAGVAAVALWSTANAQIPLGVSGYLDFVYAAVPAEDGWHGPGSATGEKPQSKLWWHDGFWWSSLYSTANDEFRIHRLNWATQTWQDTGVPIDDRPTTKADALAAGNTLYILSHNAVVSDGKTTSNQGNWARLYRYTYDANLQRYNLDAGFPTEVNEHEAEQMVLARDSAGHLWVSWVSRAETTDPQRIYQVHVTYSNNNGQTWSAPFVPNVGNTSNTVMRGDIATIVSFDNQVGIMWNNSAAMTLHFAHRTGGGNNPADLWTRKDIAIPGVPEGTNDHISMQTWQAGPNGIVAAAIKTNAKTSDPIPVEQPLIGVVVRDPATGDFVFREYSRNTDKDTRPVLVIDQGNPTANNDDKIYVFVTGKEGGSKVCYKSLNITLPITGLGQFPPGDCGTSLIEDGVYRFINDSTSMRSNANMHTGIVVQASDTTTTTSPVGTYVHGILGNPPPVVTSRLPVWEQTGVAVDASVTVTFSKKMNGTTLTPDAFSVWDGATPVAGSVTFDGNRTALFSPALPLNNNTVYTVRLNNNIMDDAGLRLNAFEASAAGTVVEQWPFTTITGTVQFEFASYLVNEDAGKATIAVVLNAPSGQPVTVDYATSDGTATAGTHYTATSGTLTFAVGETIKTFEVGVIDDGAGDGDKTVNLTLSNAVGAQLGALNPALLTIIDNEGPARVSLSAADYTVNEAAGNATITVMLNRPDVSAVTVDYATSDGTATAGSDYTATSGTLTFAPGETSKTIQVPIIDDTVDEENETVTFTLSNPTNAILGAVPVATLTIIDNDTLPSVRFDPAAVSVNEAAGTAQLTVKLSVASAFPITVKYATVAGGSATAGEDYTATSGTLTFAPGETSKTFTVDILNDALDEADETIDVTLSDPTNATLGTPFGAVVTIVDDDPQPSVAFSQAAFTKGEGSGTAEIEVVLSAASGRVVTVDYTTSDGTATAGSDYAATSGTLSFAPGQVSAIIELAILDDAQDEPDETVNLTLSNPSNATLGATSSTVLTIEDNDPRPTVAFSQAGISQDEGGGTAAIEVVLSAASGRVVTVNYATSDGTATAGSDYTATSGTLTFNPGETSKTIQVTIIDDSIDESDETVTLTLSNPENATLGAVRTTTLTIVDNDGPSDGATFKIYGPVIIKG